MKIKILRDAMCGNVLIPANDYWVSMNKEANEMLLSAGGKDLRIKALRRRSYSNAKVPSFQFYSGGGKTWSLLGIVPKFGEWIALIDYVE